MFRKSTKYLEKQKAQKLFNIIGANTRIDGTMTAKGNVRIDGVLVGKINTVARLVVGLTGFIDGTINCRNIDVLGTVKGIINSSNLIRLKSSAKIEGLVKSKRVIIENGAIIKTGINFNQSIQNSEISNAKVKALRKTFNNGVVININKKTKVKSTQIETEKEVDFETSHLNVEFG